MKTNGMFGELVFYLESCESGSMFPTLDATEKIFAVTASNATQSSYAAYCGREAKVNGKKIGSCLGDLFSINWMEDTEAADVSVETLNDQFETVLTLTTASPVMKFGDFSFMTEPIGDFEGTCDTEISFTERMIKKASHYYKKYTAEKRELGELVDSRDHNLHFLYEQVLLKGTEEAYTAMHKELDHRKFIDGVFRENFGEMANAPETPQNFDCLRMLLSELEETCGEWSDYSLKYVRKVANACDTMTEDQIGDLMANVSTHCTAQ